jgi:hypothetical protein
MANAVACRRAERMRETWLAAVGVSNIEHTSQKRKSWQDVGPKPPSGFGGWGTKVGAGLSGREPAPTLHVRDDAIVILL